MKVGFTGTRHGMTLAQHRELCKVVHELGPDEVHHGCCIGADTEFHRVMERFYPVVGHPGNVLAMRADVDGFETLHMPKPYGVRNQAIVDACDVLVAAPREMDEQPSGGTWQTIRRARKAGKRVVIVWPDGSIT